jgi:hypothetical protein
MMSTQEVANRYYELSKQNKRPEIQDELYAADVVSLEPEHAAAMGMQVITRGLDAVKTKRMARRAMIEEIHGEYCSEPLVVGNYFTVELGSDITMKGKPRTDLRETGVFRVMEGKVISEQFFY